MKNIRVIVTLEAEEDFIKLFGLNNLSNVVKEIFIHETDPSELRVKCVNIEVCK